MTVFMKSYLNCLMIRLSTRDTIIVDRQLQQLDSRKNLIQDYQWIQQKKILKRIFIAIAVLIVLLLIVALFVPKKYTVSVSETINQPKQLVYDYVVGLMWKSVLKI